VTIAGAWPRYGEPFTIDDLDRMPDDGRRYELIDGTLVVRLIRSVRVAAGRPAGSAERGQAVDAESVLLGPVGVEFVG